MSKDNLINTVRLEVEDRQAYLDLGLTLASLATRCRTNRTYVSEALMELGGFFEYIGKLRLAYFAEYRLNHPRATVDQVAQASGFRSRQTYYNVLKKLQMAG